MEDKIEVGEYVRTNEGKIFLFGGYFKAGDINSMTDIKGFLYGNQNKCCKKHSKNIIDLIENDDCLIYKIRGSDILRKGFVRKHIDLETNREYLSIEFYSLKQIEILEIVTKEQFNSVKYEVK